MSGSMSSGREVYISRSNASLHLATPSCGERGLLVSAFYVAWPAEELIRWKNTIMFRTEDLVQESRGKRGLHRVQERHTECDKLSSYRRLSIYIYMYIYIYIIYRMRGVYRQIFQSEAFP